MFLCPICLRKLRFAMCMSGVEPFAPIARYEAVLQVLQVIEHHCMDSIAPDPPVNQSHGKSSGGVPKRRKEPRHHRKQKTDPESTSTNIKNAINWLEERL